MYSPHVIDTEAPGATPGTVVRTGEDGVVIAAGDGYLGVAELQWPGKRRLPAGEFLRGRPLTPGTRLE
jgi:methionyl-tRNA formyltransferase